MNNQYSSSIQLSNIDYSNDLNDPSYISMA